MSFFDFITQNLGHVLPILLAGAIGLAIILERFFLLYAIYPPKSVDTFYRNLSQEITHGKLNEAISLCDQQLKAPLCQVVKIGLARAHLPEVVIEDGLRIATHQAQGLVQKRIGYLATIANVSTLLGLFGTILGLIHSFEAVGHADPQQKSALLSAGISTAMNATLTGLGVAIPCMIAYSILVNRSNQLTTEIDDAALKTMDLLKQRFYSVLEPSETSASQNGAPLSQEKWS
jgi:biopolymer transport protein ExbB/TolQ